MTWRGRDVGPALWPGHSVRTHSLTRSRTLRIPVNLLALQRDRENAHGYVITRDSSWQPDGAALERISLSQSKIEFGLKHRAHLKSN